MASKSHIKKLKELLGFKEAPTSSPEISPIEYKDPVDVIPSKNSKEILMSMENTGKVKKIAELFNTNNSKEEVNASFPKVSCKRMFKCPVNSSFLAKVEAFNPREIYTKDSEVKQLEIPSETEPPVDDIDDEQTNSETPKYYKSPAYLIGDKVAYMPPEVLTYWDAVNKEMGLLGKKKQIKEKC